MSGEAVVTAWCYVEPSVESNGECRGSIDSCKYTVRHPKGPGTGGDACCVSVTALSSVESDVRSLASDFDEFPFASESGVLCGW